MVLAAFTWQTGLSIGALLVAGISLVYARRADVRAGRAEERAVHSEEREKRREEREEAEALERRSGRPRVVRESDRAVPDDGEGPVVYTYEVHNDGHAVITEVRLWIEDFEGNIVSTGGGGPMTFQKGETIFVGGIGLVSPHATGLRVMVGWTDAEGQHDPEWTGLRPTMA